MTTHNERILLDHIAECLINDHRLNIDQMVNSTEKFQHIFDIMKGNFNILSCGLDLDLIMDVFRQKYSLGQNRMRDVNDRVDGGKFKEELFHRIESLKTRFEIVIKLVGCLTERKFTIELFLERIMGIKDMSGTLLSLKQV